MINGYISHLTRHSVHDDRLGFWGCPVGILLLPMIDVNIRQRERACQEEKFFTTGDRKSVKEFFLRDEQFIQRRHTPVQGWEANNAGLKRTDIAMFAQKFFHRIAS